MNRILLAVIVMIFLGLLWGGCGTSNQQAQEDSLADRQITPVPKITLQVYLAGFPGSEIETEADTPRDTTSALRGVLNRYNKEHPGISFAFTSKDELPTPENLTMQYDFALIPARSLGYLVDEGGVEPLGARLSAEWLKSFPEESLAQCNVADVIFAIPWLEAENPEDDWLLIGFALSMHKSEAVEVMKFLATDPVALERLSQAYGLRAAKKGAAAE